MHSKSEETPGAATPGETKVQSAESQLHGAIEDLRHSRIGLTKADARLDQACLKVNHVPANIAKRALQFLTGRRLTHKRKSNSNPWISARL